MNQNIKLWTASKTGFYYRSSFALTIIGVFTTYLMIATSKNLWVFSILFILSATLFAGAVSMGRQYRDYDILEQVVNNRLKYLDVWPVYGSQRVKVALNNINPNEIFAITYLGHTYFHDSPAQGGYVFDWEIYNPQVFLCRVTFTTHQKICLVFVVEKVGDQDTVSSVYRLPR